MAADNVVGRVVAIIFLVLITIASFIVLYQLFAGFYCPKSSATEPKHSNQASGIPSKSIEPTQSQPDQDIDDSELQTILSFFKRYTIATCVIFTLICIVCALDHINLLGNPGRESDPFLFLSLPLYFIGRILISLIFIGRLHFTFKGSTFEYSKCAMNSLKGAWCTMVFCALLSIVLSIPSPIKSQLLGMVVGVLFVSIDVALLFILLCLYGKKLYVLMMSGDEYFLSAMTRYSWLYTVCFISTFAVILVFVMNLASFASSGASAFGGHDIVIFISIDALSNSMSLWLNLKTANHYYYVLCGRCDKQCNKCCRSCTNNATENAQMMNDPVLAAPVGDDPPVSKEMNVTVQSADTGVRHFH
eukprot:903821_1